MDEYPPPPRKIEKKTTHEETLKAGTDPPPTMRVTPGGIPMPVTVPRLGRVNDLSRDGGLLKGTA